MAKSFTKSTNGQKINKSSKYYGSSNPFHGYAPTCTWYAYGRYYEVQGGSIPSCGSSGINGNGGAFYGYAKSSGKRKTGKTPKAGAIICWSRSGSYTGQGTRGHVAFVEAVKSDKTITISENYADLGYKRNVYDLKPDSQGRYKYYGSYGTFQGFIYQDDNYGSEDGASGISQEDFINKYGNEARTYFALRELGYTHKATCAIMGNIAQESNFNINAKSSDGNNSYGLCQWTGGRKSSLKSWCKSNGKDYQTIAGQCAFLDHELKTGYKKVYDTLQDDSKSLKEMVDYFCGGAGYGYERPSAKYANLSNRENKAELYYERYNDAGSSGGEMYIDMAQRASQLYSSDSYKYIKEEASGEESEDSKIFKQLSQRIKDYYENLKSLNFNTYNSSSAISDTSIPTNIPSKKDKIKKSSNNILSISQSMVEAPFVEVDFNGTTIGSYKGSLDDYPNYINGVEINKINGQINEYSINLIYQIRAGEDPNKIDKLISKVRYNKISIRYGDANTGALYKDDNVIITNVSMNRSYSSNRINYTIYGTSACRLVTSYKLNFPEVTDKPSNIINNLLYSNSETSSLLLDAFPGMKNKTNVMTKNLIPNNDSVITIDNQTNINCIEYLNYLVSCMSNASNNNNSVIRNSVYYISYENDFNSKLGGAFFKISEICKDSLLNATNCVYELTVGFPDDNYVMGFNVDNDIAWSILYENSNISDEYIYSIDDIGNKVKTYSPNLMSSSNILNEIQKNWWTQMTTFPINASVTLKGLLKPVMLMDYVIVNTVFYGQPHITSGLYVITGQKDTLSASGFRTTLALTRVGGN